MDKRYFCPPNSRTFSLRPETFACLSPPWQVKDETQRTPKNTSARCTSSRPSPGRGGASERPCTRTLPAPRTPTTSAECSATSRTRCCSSPWGTTESSEPLISVEKQEGARRVIPSLNCHVKQGPEEVWIRAIFVPSFDPLTPVLHKGQICTLHLEDAFLLDR